MLKYLVEKEFKQVMRNPFLPRFIIAFPLMALLVLPLSATFEIRNVKLALVDNDRSGYSRQLSDKILSSGTFRLAEVSPDYAYAMRAIEADRADIVLEIPAGFGRGLVRDATAPVLISANTVNGAMGGLGSAYLVSILNDFSLGVRSEWLRLPSGIQTPAFGIVSRFRYNPHLEYPVFMVPALMVMILAMLCGFLPALNIVGEKEKGTIEQMNVTPVRKFPLILSKLIPYWVMGFIVLTLSFGIARLAYGLVPAGYLRTIYLFASVFILAMSGFGLVISNYAKSVQQAMFMMFFFVISMVLMSGLYTPIASMPDWAQLISDFSPLKYLIQVLRLIYLKGSVFSDLQEQFFRLCAFAVFFNGWAVLSYRKTD